MGHMQPAGCVFETPDLVFEKNFSDKLKKILTGGGGLKFAKNTTFAAV